MNTIDTPETRSQEKFPHTNSELAEPALDSASRRLLLGSHLSALLHRVRRGGAVTESELRALFPLAVHPRKPDEVDRDGAA